MADDNKTYYVDENTFKWLEDQYTTLEVIKKAANDYSSYYNVDSGNFDGSVFKSDENEYHETILGDFCNTHIALSLDIVKIIDAAEKTLDAYRDYCKEFINKNQETAKKLNITADQFSQLDLKTS